MEEAGEWTPPFASRKLAGSYRLLERYLEAARRKGREDLVEKALLGEDDYRLLRRAAEEAPGCALDLVDRLASALEERIDPETAREALEAEGVKADPATARRIIARLLASWLVEAGDYWGIIRLRGGDA